MAIKTHFDVTFNCGHSKTIDLSKKPAGKRAGTASWLSQRDCSNCQWTKDSENRRIQSLEVAAEFEQQYQLPPLRGSEAQLKWAPILRFEFLMKTYETSVQEGSLTEDEWDEKFLTFARKITRSGWWFDHKDSDPEDAEELLSTAYHDPDEIIEENDL